MSLYIRLNSVVAGEAVSVNKNLILDLTNLGFKVNSVFFKLVKEDRGVYELTRAFIES